MAGISFVKVIDAGPRYTTVLADDGKTYTLKGDRNWRNNNPGNIEYGPFAKSMGAIGSDGRFAVFPSVDHGVNAQVLLQFDGKGYRDKTISEAISRYAPEFENNSAAYAAEVAASAGVPVTTKMSDLTPEQRRAFIAAQHRVEGMKPGKIIGAEGEPVSPDVAKQFSAVRLPPLNIPSPSVAGMQSVGAGTAPPPLPRPRPETPFVPLPAPAPLRPPMMASLPQDAMFGVGRLVPGKKAVIPTDAVTNTGAPMDARLQSLVTPLPPRGLAIDQIGREADNGRLNGYRAIQEMGPSSRGAAPPPLAGAPVPFQSLPRPGVGIGAVAGLGGMSGGADGVVLPNPNMPRYVPPAIPRVGPQAPIVPPSPVRVAATPPTTAPSAPAGGFDIGGFFGGIGNTLGQTAQNVGANLGTAATNAIEGTKTTLGNTAQSATDLLKNELIGTVKGRTLLLNTALGLPAPGTHDPFRYGNTVQERQESARRRQAMMDGAPYLPPTTGVRTAVDIPRIPAPLVQQTRTSAPPQLTPLQRRQAQQADYARRGLDQFGMIPS